MATGPRSWPTKVVVPFGSSMTHPSRHRESARPPSPRPLMLDRTTRVASDPIAPSGGSMTHPSRHCAYARPPSSRPLMLDRTTRVASSLTALGGTWMIHHKRRRTSASQLLPLPMLDPTMVAARSLASQFGRAMLCVLFEQLHRRPKRGGERRIADAYQPR